MIKAAEPASVAAIPAPYPNYQPRPGHFARPQPAQPPHRHAHAPRQRQIFAPHQGLKWLPAHGRQWLYWAYCYIKLFALVCQDYLTRPQTAARYQIPPYTNTLPGSGTMYDFSQFQTAPIAACPRPNDGIEPETAANHPGKAAALNTRQAHLGFPLYIHGHTESAPTTQKKRARHFDDQTEPRYPCA